MKKIFLIFVFSIRIWGAESVPDRSQLFRLDFEGALAWQDYNRNQIPNSTSGTRLDFARFSSGAQWAPRFYFSYRFNSNHSLRALVFPFQTEGTQTFSENILFDGETFEAGQPIQGKYRFHSYRLTYRYRFFDNEFWTLTVGFTAKLRNALVALKQNSISREYSNLGFVPLLHFNANYWISPVWRLEFDMDALAAPQGRAEDVALSIWYLFHPDWEFGVGYRTLEGGADNSKVYTFAWFHFVTATAAFKF
ncbi:MAG: hypothetical protein ACKOA8_20245 [Deltaproteobacteria bacterium]|jgi:hypothetical protein